MICDAGDVVVVPFPFVDLPISKPRPAVVLSRRRFNAANRHCLLAMVTTAAGSRWPDDIAVIDLAAAGLKRPCVVRWKVFTLPNDLISRRAGTLAGPDRTAVMAGLHDAIGN